MKTKSLIGAAVLALTGAVPIHAQQLMVYDAHNRVVGRYESNGAQLDLNQDLGEAAIRQINGTWLALPITGRGFIDNAAPFGVAAPNPNANAEQIQFAGVVYWSGNGCTGMPYVYAVADAMDTEYNLRPEPAAPLVGNAIVLSGIAYYATPATYGTIAQSDPQPPVICSQESVTTEGPDCSLPLSQAHTDAGPCLGIPSLLPAMAYNLANLGLTPPFSVK